MSVSSSSSQSTIDSTSNYVTPLYRPLGPFHGSATFQYGMEFLEIKAVRRVAQVCKLWHNLLEAPHVWKRMSEIQGIPLVEGHSRDYKADLKTLCPITTSGWQISQTLGTPVGKTPAIAEKWFLLLLKPDPFEPAKLMKETFRFVCTYSRLTRLLDEKTPLKLDELGTLGGVLESNESSTSSASSSIATEQSFVAALGATKIALSLKNQRALSQYPLSGQDNMPVFDEDSYGPVFDQCDTCVAKNGVHFMRTNVAEESRNQTFSNQLALVKARGVLIGSPELGVIPLEVRTLDSAVSILYKGICSDGEEPLTYARASNTLVVDNNVRQAVSGGFVRGSGLVVIGENFFAGDDLGVAPGGPAEVPGTWILDTCNL